MSISVQKTGDWNKLSSLFNRLKGGISPTIRVMSNDLGELTVQKLQEHIDSQDLGWTPLSEKTIVLKAGDSRIYVQTGLLRNSFKVLKLETSKKVSVYVGIDPSATTEDGTKVSDVLIYMEYGTDKQVPRPLVRPTYEEIKPLIRKECIEAMKAYLRGDS